MPLRILKKIGNTLTALFFFASLLALVYLVGGREVLLWLQATRWIETSCKVQHASVESHEDSEGEPSYAIRTSYNYKDEAVEYTGWRYDFSIGMGRSEYRPIAKAVRYLKRNSTVPCYYKPNDPQQSVIDRGFHSSMLFTLIPLVFLLMFLLWIAQAMKLKTGRNRKLP